jgi:hypothetical protein
MKLISLPIHVQHSSMHVFVNSITIPLSRVLFEGGRGILSADCDVDKGLAQELDMECSALEALARESPVKWEEVRPDAVNLGSVAHSVQSELELATFEMQKMLQQLQMRRTDNVGPRPDAAMPSPSYQALFHRSCQGCDLTVPKGTKLFRAQVRPPITFPTPPKP